MMHSGSCLCGAVQYRINGAIGEVVMCHCQRCRKANGSDHAVNAPIQRADFQLIQGESSLRAYSSSAGVYRVFCGNCGAPLYSKRDADPVHYRLRLGTLDTPLDQRPSMHIFVASKAEWEQIADDLPQYAERPA